MENLGRIGILVNPVAQNGAASSAAALARETLMQKTGAEDIKIIETEYAGHATHLASDLNKRFGTLVVIGGDGIAHEVANGFMKIPETDRPNLAVIPVGSGNDYARTLGMSQKVDVAATQILEGKISKLDVGCVNGEYFLETLSFGIDAAIAHDTVERRKKNGRKGAILYAESGYNQLIHHRVAQKYQAHLTDLAPMPTGRYIQIATNGNKNNSTKIAGESYIFAVQIGKTYGGHFKICPDAIPTDGLFDICIAHPPLGLVRAIAIFTMAKGGHHTNFKLFDFYRAGGLVIDFKEAPPSQADGEKIEGTHFEISMHRQALRVISSTISNA